MAAMIRRRFVNIVAENYKSGVYSLHRLDVSKHLFYPSTLQALEANANGRMIERLRELPAPCTRVRPGFPTVPGSPKMAFFGLVSTSKSEGSFLCLNDAGHSLLKDVDEHIQRRMPSLEGFKGPVHVSLSIAQAGAKEDDLYIMHGGVAADSLQSKSGFDVLRFDTKHKGWHWQSLPLPPPLEHKLAHISSYTVVDGGRTICLSSAAEGVGTHCFDAVRGEWWRAGDWVLPFDGRAEYLYDHNLWLGFSHQNPRELCVASVLSLGRNQAPTLQHMWQDQMPGEWMATTRVVNLLNLGSGRFAIAKVFKVVRSTVEGDSGYFSDWEMSEDEFLVLTGVEIRQSLETFQHKSIRYMCTNDRIHQVI